MCKPKSKMKSRGIYGRAAVTVFLLLALCLPFMGDILSVGVSGYTEYISHEEITPDENQVSRIKKDVRIRAGIPGSYKSFSCKAFAAGDDVCYKLTWADRKGHEIIIGYNNGLIYGYATAVYKWYASDYEDITVHDRSKPTFPRISEEEQEKIAYEHICRLNPELHGKFRLERLTAVNNLSRWVDYCIYRVEKGIDVSNTGRILIDRNSGELLDFFFDEWWNEAEFPDFEAAEEQAREFYIEKAEFSGEYKLYYGYDRNGELYPCVLPIYKVNLDTSYNISEKGAAYIDGITGEKSAYRGDMYSSDVCLLDGLGVYGYYSSVCGNPDPNDGEPETDVDESDIARYEKLHDKDKYITAKEAEESLKNDSLIKFDKGLRLTEDEISYDRDGSLAVRALRCVRFETAPDNEADNISLYAKLNAVTGEIVYYDKDYGDNVKRVGSFADEKPASKEAAAKSAAAHFLGSRVGEYRVEEITNDMPYSVWFVRYINGLPAKFDDMSVCIGEDGELLYFNYSYCGEDIYRGKLLTKEEAIEQCFKQSPPKALYEGFADGERKAHVYPVYSFDSTYCINAATGERYTDEGEPYCKEEAQPIVYTDISGHKYEKEITELCKYGVHIGEGGELHPDEPITAEEFLKLCSVSPYELYDRVYTTDPYTNKTKYAPDPRNGEALTYGALARLYVRYYSERQPDPKSRFKQPYKNVTEDTPDHIYIAAARQNGYISKGDEFPYDKTLTKGEVLKILYDYYADDCQKKPLYEIFKI